MSLRPPAPVRSLIVLVVSSSASCIESNQPPVGEPIQTELATEARVVCEEDGARVVTPAVRALPEGIHISIVDRSSSRAFYLRSAHDPNQNEGGAFRGSDVKTLVTTFPPGELLVGCFPTQSEAPQEFYATSGQGYARLSIVDPEGLWISSDLGCNAGHDAGLFRAERQVDDTPQDAARRAVPGIRADDHLVRPGYPETQWHFEPLVVLRGEEAVAVLTIIEQPDRWDVVVRACPGSEVGGA